MQDKISQGNQVADVRTSFHGLNIEANFRDIIEREFAGPRIKLGLKGSAVLAEFLNPEFFAGMSSFDATDVVGQVQYLISQLKVIEAHAVVAAVGPVAVSASSVRKGTDVSLEDVRSTELGAYLNISPLAARNLAEHCRDLVRWLPVTMSHLQVGNIDDAKAKIVTQGSHRIFTNLCLIDTDIKSVDDDRVFAMMKRFEAIVTRNIAIRTRSQLRQTVNQAIARLTPLAEETRHSVARDERAIEFLPYGDGMTLMQALMTSLDAAKVQNVLEYCAKNDETLGGTIPQRMSDALVGIITGESEVEPERRMTTARINVVVSAETLLGLSDASASVIGSEMALTAQAVRELAEKSHLRRMMVDSKSGAVLELGRRSYEPSRQIKDFVKLRDRKCRAPGCVRNAMRCDVDHIEAWDDGGETNVDNLAALCRRHHILKTIGTWQYELKPNGDAVWRLPNGHVVIDYFDPLVAIETGPEPAKMWEPR